jgi:sugar phosphate isomerase/epimerase
MQRREFMAHSAVALGSAAVVAGAGKLWGQAPDAAKLSRIAVMSRCFRSVLKNAAFPNDPNRTLDILDFPAMVADRYGVHHVEFQHTDFASTEPEFLEDFRSRVQKAKSQMNQINLEFGPITVSSPDPILRLEAVDLTKRWVDHAAMLGCPRVMVNPGWLAAETRPAAIEALKAIDRFAKPKSVFITLENKDEGPSANYPRAPWEVIVEVIHATGLWANPDVGNFPDNEARAAGLRALYPLSSGSSHCHYNPEKYSEAEAIRISKEVGYKGLFSIESETNNGPDPYAAVQTILDELLRDI